jgi:hypothetical protein
MNPDQDLAKKIETYQQLGKENPNVDVSMLMLNALTNEKQNMVSAKAKKWAYLFSIGVPPFGLLVALYYYMRDEDDAKQVAWVCIWLTIASLLLYWLSYKLFFSSTNVTPQQIEQIKPSDIQQILQ